MKYFDHNSGRWRINWDVEPLRHALLENTQIYALV